MIGNADLTKAIVKIWNDSDLNAKFQAYWSSSLRSQFPVLNDEEAEGDHPFPYCIFDVGEPSTTGRMTGRDNQIYETQQTTLDFRVETKDPSQEKSAKEISAELVGEIMRVFGGHPTKPGNVVGYPLDYGHITNCQKQTDFGARTDKENWSWTVRYMLMTDIPVAVA